MGLGMGGFAVEMVLLLTEFRRQVSGIRGQSLAVSC
jgi:hypothetical protein